MTLRAKLKSMREEDTEPASEHMQEGEIESMGPAYDDEKMVHVGVKLPPAPKAGKGDNEKGKGPSVAMDRSVTAKIPKGHSGRFALGDKVRVTTRLEKVTKGAD